MTYIAVIAVLGILLLQASGAIALGSVGGSLTLGFVLILAALAVGMHEAWTQKRGPLGWIVDLFVTFLSVLVAAPARRRAHRPVAQPLRQWHVARRERRRRDVACARCHHLCRAGERVGRAVARQPLAINAACCTRRAMTLRLTLLCSRTPARCPALRNT